jgi:uncharacterized protein YraI
LKARHWSLAIALILINYIIFASLFSRLLDSDFGVNYATRTPIPTFTPAPAQPLIIIPTPTPITPVPTPTATRVLGNLEVEAGSASLANEDTAQSGVPDPNSQASDEPQRVAPGSVNIRSGPGVNFSVIGTLNSNTAVPIIGRNSNATWWKIKISGDGTGWVSDAVVSATHTDIVPIAEAPAPPPVEVSAPVPQPAAESNPPPAPEKPKYQFEPVGWYDDTNFGLTRFLGDIVDKDGNPVNGVFVQASCGNYSTISYPSGPVGWGSIGESADWPAGFYDITIDSKPVPCIWTLTVVDTDDRKIVKARLSESIPVEVTGEKSVIVAGWRKNW